VRLRLAHRKRACGPEVFITAAQVGSTHLIENLRSMAANVLQRTVSSVANQRHLREKSPLTATFVACMA
jgi:hypothetical protein